jgi:hypothetical protein
MRSQTTAAVINIGDYATWGAVSMGRCSEIEDPPHRPGGRNRSSEQPLSRCGAAPLAKDSGGNPRGRFKASAWQASQIPIDAETLQAASLPLIFSPHHHGRLEEQEGRSAGGEHQRQELASI